MSDEKEGPVAGEDSLLLPYERKKPSKDSVESNLFELLDSDGEITGSENPDDADELESDDDASSGESDDPADDEDDVDDTDDDDDADDEEDEDDVDDEDSDEDSNDDDETEETRPVKVNGEIVAEVTFDEAIAGYSRTTDYTQKSQANAQEQATAMAEVGEKRERYDTRLAQLEDVMKQMTPAEPDWDALRKDDPAEYAAVKADHAERLDALGRVAKERDQVQEEAQKETSAALTTYLQGELVKLIDAVPEWKNEATRETGIGELRAFAQDTYGFSDQELNSVVDHRILLLLRENKDAREQTKSGKKKIRAKKKGARRMKPGGARNTGRKAKTKNRKANQRARENLAHSGSVRDAASAIEGLLGDDD